MFPDIHIGDPSVARRYLATLEGAALGDAFGWALEDADPQIWLQRDPTGGVLRELVPVGGRQGLSGDGMQQLLFAAEGLLRAQNARSAARAELDPVPYVHAALLRWLETQRGSGPPPRPDGWLVGVPELHARRARTSSTAQSLRTGLCGRRDRPVNNLVDTSPLPRAVAAGLAGGGSPWDLGRDVVGVTHGNPRVQLAGGAVAALVSALVAGSTWEEGLDATWTHLAEAGPAGAPLLAALDRAVEQADLGEPGPARLTAFGDGRDPESALAIAIYAVGAARPGDVIGLAVLHAGASDRTGLLAGALAGARHGPDAIPRPAAGRLELGEVVAAVARDLYLHFGDGPFFEPSEEDWTRYPG